jgi:hypothetical protein
MSSPDEDAFFDAVDGLDIEVEEEEPHTADFVTTDGLRLAYESKTVNSVKLSGIFDEVEGVEIEGPSDSDEVQITPEDIEIKQRAFSFLEEGYKDRKMSDLTRIDEEEDGGEGEHISGPAAMTSESENTKSESGSSSGNSAGRPALLHFLPKISLKNPFRRRSVGEDKSDPTTVKPSGGRKRRETRDTPGLKLSQAFAAHAGACWCMKISISGKYLATCGQDAVVHVWSIPNWTARLYNRESHSAAAPGEQLDPGKRETEQEEWSPDVASGNHRANIYLFHC